MNECHTQCVLGGPRLDLNRRHGIALITFSVLSQFQVGRTCQLLCARLGRPFPTCLAKVAGGRVLKAGPFVRLRGLSGGTAGRLKTKNKGGVTSEKRLESRQASADDAQIDFEHSVSKKKGGELKNRNKGENLTEGGEC